MNPVVLVVAALAGGAGSALRFLVDAQVSKRLGKNWPWATNVINATGSLALGFLTGIASHDSMSAPLLTVLGTGLIGGYTTFSTASIETVRLLIAGRVRASAANAFGSIGLGVILALLGLWLGTLA